MLPPRSGDDLLDSDDKATREGLRAIDVLRCSATELPEKGEGEAMMLCARRFGGARGPPGTEGLFAIITVRVERLTGGLFMRTLAELEDDEDRLPGLGRSLLVDRLAFRPNEAKKAPVFEVGVGGDNIL